MNGNLLNIHGQNVVPELGRQSAVRCADKIRKCQTRPVLTFLKMVKDQLGKDVNLLTKEQIKTPFLPEDNKTAPAGRPLSEKSKCCLCPHCLASFPVLDTSRGERPPQLVCGVCDED